MTGDWRSWCIGSLWALGIAAAPSNGLAASPLPAGGVTADALLQQAADADGAPCNRYRLRHWFRDKIVRDSDLANYGLRMDPCWQECDRDRPVVILLHGFNSTPERNAALLAPIRTVGYPCGTFAYPNDHDIRTSARLLSCELRRFAAVAPDRRVVLVCHSMGGMVARACLEDPCLDCPNVGRLIMIAPPTHGSLIANFAVGTDLWEHWLSRSRGGPWTRFRDSVVDGLGEAAIELCPNSEFLAELNRRPRNPRVRYSILLGTGALMREAQLEWIRQSVCDSLARVPGCDASADQLNAVLNDIDELVEGKGDGVVAVKRGRLDGVSDTLILPFGHIAVTGEGNGAVLRHVHQAVLERVQ